MRSKLIQSLAVGLLAVALAFVPRWFVPRWQASMENVTWGWRVQHFAKAAPSTEQIKLILLDQASLDWGASAQGWSWPWPRTVYGAIVDFVARAHPRAIAFDVLYTEPSAYEVADDEALGEAIARSRAFVGSVFLGRQAQQATAWPDFLPRPENRIEGVDVWLNAARVKHLTKPGAAFPVPEIATNAALLADVNDTPDRDAVFRRASLFGIFDGVVMPTLGVAAYLAGNPGAHLHLHNGSLDLARGRIPVDDRGRVILRFRGKSGTHQAYSAASVIESEMRLQEGAEPVLSPDVFRDKYVLFGFSAPGLKDLRPTPVAGDYPGVEIHATLLDNLLAADGIADAPRGLAMLATLLLGLVGAAAAVGSRKAWQTVVAFVVIVPIPLVAGFAAYTAGVWWPVAEGTLSAAFGLVGGVIVNYATEGRQKRFIKSAFKQYLGETVIDQIIADPSRLKLGGEKRELTMFFSDLEKFSSFSEKLEPPQLIELLNVYLSDVGRVIMEEGGYLDKYIGDAIVAFWNAPVAQPDHATRAVRAALKCQRLLAERQADLSRMAAGMPVRMRIGLNTGEVVVGNMGSEERFNYTMLGDAANLASRLEGANKAFGTFLMMAESTWTAAREAILGRELGAIRVVGRKSAVRVYQAMALAGETLPGWVADFERALALCREKKWREALGAFEAIPDDPASAAYAKRLRPLAGGTETDWDGVWNLTEK